MAWTTPRTWVAAEKPTAATLNAHIRDNLLALFGLSWQTPTLVNSWVDFGGTYAPARYRKEGDLVRIRGMVKSGTVGATTAIFTLPSGYIPPYDFDPHPNFTVNRIIVYGTGAGANAGKVCCVAGATTNVSLDVTFALT